MSFNLSFFLFLLVEFEFITVPADTTSSDSTSKDLTHSPASMSVQALLMRISAGFPLINTEDCLAVVACCY